MAKKKTTAVAKTAKVAKPPALATQKAHSTATVPHGVKHAATPKKHKAATKKHAVKTGLALAPGDVACCAAQALAASLRLATGAAVHDEDVLALYWRTADDPDEGATVLATLEAAREYGLGGVRLAGQWRQRAIEARDQAAPGAERLKIRAAVDGDLADVPHFAALASAEDRQPDFKLGQRSGLLGAHDLILSLDLPEGPHAVTVAPDGSWWSWGESYSPASFPGAVIEEAWAVTW